MLVFKLNIWENTSFESITILRDRIFRGVLRFFHANGASLFFVCLYLHIGRGLYYGSFTKRHTWSIGVTILLLTMATAFLGYVLPWGQISFWGASVIIGLISAIPKVGSSIAIWLWGGFSVSDSTLSRFLSLHFLLPFVLRAMVLIHIIFLHSEESSRPVSKKSAEKIYFTSIYVTKDILGLWLALGGLLFIRLVYPAALGDVENFILADMGTTPLHIIPEWYYLFAYAILRAIPRKLGGVLALVFRIAILYLLPLRSIKTSSVALSPQKKINFWGLVVVFFALTWIGASPVEYPYIETGAILTLCYFSLFWLIVK